jgi:phosphoglycerate dehydrogenase-like enzyme
MTSMPRPLLVVAQGGMIGNLLRSHLTHNVHLHIVSSLNNDAVAGQLADADVWISGRFTSEMAANARRLRLVQTTGIGTDSVDIGALPPGTSLCNVRGHDNGVGEYVFMVMLSLQRGLLGMDRRMRSGDWTDRNGTEPRPELHGKTLAVIGLGTIGEAVVRIASAFKMKVQAIAQNPDKKRSSGPELDFLGGPADLHTVLATADIVVLALPLTEQTKEMIGPDEFRVMKSSAYLINVSRGGVVHEAALYEALRDRSIAGAGVDVWYRYPDGNERMLPSRYPFHELDNIIMTPHIAGWTEETILNRIRQIDDNLRRLDDGEPLLNLVFRAPE